MIKHPSILSLSFLAAVCLLGNFPYQELKADPGPDLNMIINAVGPDSNIIDVLELKDMVRKMRRHDFRPRAAVGGEY